MTGRRRGQRRQGVVYGPIAAREHHQPASALGRLVGAIVIVGALAVLGVGILAVLGDNAAATPTPTPTLAGVGSPSPSTSPTATIRPTATLAPVPTPSPTLQATPTFAPSPTPFLVELVEGPGKITFAADYNNNLVLIDRRVEFTLDEQMAWAANIGEPVGRVLVNFDVYRVDTATMAETKVHSATFVGRNETARFYYAKAPVRREVDGPGVFVMRYSIDGRTISEGYFRVTG